ncbi:Chs6p PWA37_003373 [Arxiozyma heterogenica]|uniref:Chs6p n=1 Tax=Arxiozyma heterogenica TaxID=278026 RepID=UPI002F11ABB1
MNYIWKPKFSKSNKSVSKITSEKNDDNKKSKSFNLKGAKELDSKKITQNKILFNPMDVPRILEHRFGESLGFRNYLLKKFSRMDRIGLGPPDLMHFTIYDNFNQEEVGQYFYVTGMDVSNENMAIALMKMLKTSQKTSSGLDHNNIATFCSLNIFSKVDLRIRYEYDNKSTFYSYAVNCSDGVTQVPLTEKIWEELFVSACLRSLIINNDPSRKLPGLVEYPLGIDLGGISVCERIITLLCKYLPRCLDAGWDSTKSVHPTIFNNYLMDALSIFISIVPHLIEFAIDLLNSLSIEDENNGLFYKCALILLLKQHSEKDFDFITILNDTLAPLFPVLDSLKPKDINSFQLLNCMSDLLNLQVDFLLQNGDYELALTVAKKSTELALDSFDSWYYLSKCYIQLQQYENALITLNSMPNLPQYDKITKGYINEVALYEYYVRPLGDINHSDKARSLLSNEFDVLSRSMKHMKDSQLKNIIFGRIVMPNDSKEGYIEDIWDNICMKIGPIYGPHSVNLINYVPIKEVESIHDMKLLSRNSISKQYNWSQRKVYNLLIELVLMVGWNKLLELRSKVFIMESEYSTSNTDKNENNDGSNSVENNKNIKGYVRLKDTPLTIRKKRICERWLDQLFLDIYDDLDITTHISEKQDVKRSGLEWELLGLTMLRTWQWDNAIICLRTSIKARFDVVSVRTLLELFLRMETLNDPIPLDYDTVIELLVQYISYQSRFYDNFQVITIQVMHKLCLEIGMVALRSRIEALAFTNSRIFTKVERLLGYISLIVEETNSLK